MNFDGLPRMDHDQNRRFRELICLECHPGNTRPIGQYLDERLCDAHREARRELLRTRETERKRAYRARTQPATEPRSCEQCGETFVPARSDARFCSGRCRVANHRS